MLYFCSPNRSRGLFPQVQMAGWWKVAQKAEFLLRRGVCRSYSTPSSRTLSFQRAFERRQPCVVVKDEKGAFDGAPDTLPPLQSICSDLGWELKPPPEA